MKIKTLIITFIIFVFCSLNAEATQLPKELRTFLQSQKKIPSVRYDGIIVYNNDVMYIPVFPAYPEKVEELKIVKTYPENKSMDSFPDMVLFNTNMSLLKIIRTGKDVLTVKDIPDLPVEIKTGALPQDIMVPRGLVFPENLAGILGDVRVPLIGSAKTQTFITVKKSAPLPNGKKIENNVRYNVPASLKDKLFFVNNFQTEYLQVFSSDVAEPLYSLKTSGVMKDVKPVDNGKYLLAAIKNKKIIDVIDIDKECVIKSIDLTAEPSEIIVDDTRGKAYVASVKSESLFVIDLNTMTMKEKIQLVGAPQRLSISPSGNQIAYLDLKTSNIYVLDLNNNYENKLITNYPNTSKIVLGDNILYLIARTQPKLRVVSFDLLQDNKVGKTKKEKLREKFTKDEHKKENVEIATNDVYGDFEFYDGSDEQEDELSELKTYSTSIKDYDIGAKPIDIYEYKNNIFALCAGNNTIYKFDESTGNIISEKLPVGGFSKAITPVPNSAVSIITNMSDLKYVVFDLEKAKPLQTLPINEYVNTITILEKNNG